MIFLISHKGRGLLVFPLVLVPIGLAGLLDLMFGRYFLLGFCIGFLMIGVLCWVLGRRWTAMGRDDRFCGGSLQTWGIVYGIFGGLLLPAAINIARAGF